MLTCCSISQNRIKIDSINTSPVEVSSLLFGSFFEFLDDFINGYAGIWAQELINRGFDMPDITGDGASNYWFRFRTSDFTDNKLSLLPGGYNENGLYFQRITKKSSSGLIGISQNIFLSDTTCGEFYAYLRTNDSTNSALFLLVDTKSNDIVFSHRIENISNEWGKYSLNTPTGILQTDISIVIALDMPGTLDIDEASFMQCNNVGGVRTEFYNIFKEWQPGIIRYPGGWFADTKMCFIDNAIGNIDKRKSPNETNRYISQRMDFGVDEFMRFCQSINAEAHLVVNLENGTPEQAVHWIDYCNGDSTTEYGRKRIENGRSEPYNVKYWEIGNEQWIDPHNMSLKYMKFYNAMKQADSSIKTMIDGDIWGGANYLDTVFNVIGLNTDFYSYHSIYPSIPSKDGYSEEQVYYNFIASSYAPEIEINQMLLPWISKWDTAGVVKMVLTELFLDFKLPWNQYKHSEMNNTVQTGLWMAGYLNSCMRNSAYLSIVEKSFGIGDFMFGINSQGRRIFYRSPLLSTMLFMQNTRGKYIMKTHVSCDNFSPPLTEGMLAFYDIPYLDATATFDNSYIYFSVVNRSIKDTLITELVLPVSFPKSPVKVSILSADNPHYSNTIENPDRINYITENFILSPIYHFPPLSHTVFKIPIKYDLPPDDNNGNIDDTLLTNKNTLRITPNPVQDYLILFSEKGFSDNSKLSIYNLLGELIAEFNLNTSDNYQIIRTYGFPVGTYFAVLINDEDKLSHLFIKI